jgi:hypothetical protein
MVVNMWQAGFRINVETDVHALSGNHRVEVQEQNFDPHRLGKSGWLTHARLGARP